jgi:FkbM family methyltransferase
MHQKLIYDVGVNDGTDSAYYLTQAERVVGIEASPLACAELSRCFSKEIASGQYVLLNVGISDQEGEFDFWVCESHHEWSSFDRSLAGRNGEPHHSVKVQAKRFATIIAEYGRPDFVKIDIEGYDIHCLTSLTPETAPPYISVELAHQDGDKLIEQLTRLGYQEFKIVNQRTMSPALPIELRLEYALPRKAENLLRRVHTKLRGRWRDGDWKFAFGSSGAFGEKAPGGWVGGGRAHQVWRFIKDVDGHYNSKSLGNWFDIHARRPGLAG